MIACHLETLNYGDRDYEDDYVAESVGEGCDAVEDLEKLLSGMRMWRKTLYIHFHILYSGKNLRDLYSSLLVPASIERW